MTTRSRKPDARLERRSAPSLRTWRGSGESPQGQPLARNVAIDCGWGRLIFGHTFPDPQELARTLTDEEPGKRDLALYLQDPHVVLSVAPQELFLDPSHTYRLWFFNHRPGATQPRGFVVRRLRSEEDAEAMHRLLTARNMVPPPPSFVWENRRSQALKYFVAEDSDSGAVIGAVTGVDHVKVFDDPEKGSSLWCLAVDPQARQPGVGRALVTRLADYFAARGRAFMDLSVFHDNEAVIRLYESSGFVRVPVFCLKTRNAINEALFSGSGPEGRINPYGRIIIDEARRRGIGVRMLDAAAGYFALKFGGQRIVCRESLSELTTAIAMSRCADKRITRSLVSAEGISVPAQIETGQFDDDARRMLAEHGRLVVKPASGEQGHGVAVNLGTEQEVAAAMRTAGAGGDAVLVEQFVSGRDLRVIVIDQQVVAAAIRHPAAITGNGRDTIDVLIRKQSRRREAATGGESRIPVDDETRRCLARHGYVLDDVLPADATIQVRETANLHTGGTMEDVTVQISAAVRDAALTIARALDIPVVGLDFIVAAADAEEYFFIEANERPGLANHEPQPTAERFIDLLFPQTAARSSS